MSRTIRTDKMEVEKRGDRANKAKAKGKQGKPVSLEE